MSRLLEFLVAPLTVGVWILVLRAPQEPEASAMDPATRTLTLDELVVKRLRVVEEDGSDRVVIAGAARFPKPRLGGRELSRSIAPGGMVFYRANGDECGGVGVVDTPQGGANVIILDYANNDGIGFGVREGTDGTWSAGLTIADRPPLDVDPEKAAALVHERLSIENTSGRAQIVLADPEGRARIELRVDEEGVPALRILDEDGTVLFEAP